MTVVAGEDGSLGTSSGFSALSSAGDWSAECHVVGQVTNNFMFHGVSSLWSLPKISLFFPSPEMNGFMEKLED
jgi:hypothetical protein